MGLLLSEVYNRLEGESLFLLDKKRGVSQIFSMNAIILPGLQKSLEKVLGCGFTQVHLIRCIVFKMSDPSTSLSRVFLSILGI